MSFETIRINELAKEMRLTSKEIIEKFSQLGVTNKTHSSTVTMEQVKRLKDFIAAGSVKEVKKPKAFVVKKAKTPEADTPESVDTEKQEITKVEVKERPKVEVVKQAPQSKLEIVRRAPQRPDGQTVIKRPDKLKRRDGDDGGKKFPPRGDAKPPKKEFSKESSAENKSFAKGEKSSEKKPIQRHIIPQDIYENKGSGRKRSDGKRKDKDFNSKKEEQERISLEKAAAQKHKKRVHKDEEVAEVKQIVVNQAMTISELSEKIHKTPAEIVKFLMLHGVMATVNQLIDVDVIKQICAEYNLEVLDEDLDAYIEEEMEKEQKHKALTEVDKKLVHTLYI